MVPDTKVICKMVNSTHIVHDDLKKIHLYDFDKLQYKALYAEIQLNIPQTVSIHRVRHILSFVTRRRHLTAGWSKYG